MLFYLIFIVFLVLNGTHLESVSSFTVKKNCH